MGTLWDQTKSLISGFVLLKVVLMKTYFLVAFFIHYICMHKSFYKGIKYEKKKWRVIFSHRESGPKAKDKIFLRNSRNCDAEAAKVGSGALYILEVHK